SRLSKKDGRDAHPTIIIKIVSYLIRDPYWLRLCFGDYSIQLSSDDEADFRCCKNAEFLSCSIYQMPDIFKL
ncbi:MAG: hypothetical protein LH628_12515, partial [Microcoleus sp. CAN_BIN18]|nr:hypothetical protein [Microcoleus sp. CAN_BIN18]